MFSPSTKMFSLLLKLVVVCILCVPGVDVESWDMRSEREASWVCNDELEDALGSC